MSTGIPVCAAQSSLSSNTDVASEGYFVISWDLGAQSGGQEYLLQRASSDTFDTAFDRSIPAAGEVTISGLENGTYYFRAGSAEQGQWGDTLAVEVRHHTLTRAFGFFSLGLVLFIALVATIVIGTRRTRAIGSGRS